MRGLLKGKKWGDFYRARFNTLKIEDKNYDLRIGHFFNIPAIAIICKRQYVILRKLQMKQWDNYDRKNYETNGFRGLFIRDEDLRGDWYFIAINDGTSDYSVDGQERYFGPHRDSFVLEASKFDVLRPQMKKAKK